MGHDCVMSISPENWGFWKWIELGGFLLGVVSVHPIVRSTQKRLRNRQRNRPMRSPIQTLSVPLPEHFEARLSSLYLHRVLAVTEHISFPVKARDIPIDKILIPPRLGMHQEIQLGWVPAVRDGSKLADPDASHRLDNGEVLGWPELRALPGSLVVLGPAGTGKTTLLHYEARLCAKARLDVGAQWGSASTPIPVLLRADELIEFLRQSISLQNAVRLKIDRELRKAGADLSEPESKELDHIFAAAWQDRGVRLLVDALDERITDDDRLKIIESLQDTSGGGYPFLMVSRPLRGGIAPLRNGRILYLAPFDSKVDVPRFIGKWFDGVLEGDRKRDETLMHLEKHRRVMNLCRTPLLLAFLCLAAEWGEISGITTRVKLYETVLDGLLEKWPLQRPGTRPSAFADLKLRVVGRIAWMQLETPKPLKGSEVVAEILRSFADTYRLGYDEARSLLEELAYDDCVLRELGDGLDREYRFFHQGLAEYVVARAAAADAGYAGQLIREITGPRWQGAFAMYVAMSDDPMPLIEQVAESEALDGSVLSRLVVQCMADCIDRFKDADAAECAWLAQALTPLAWRSLTPYEPVSLVLEQNTGDEGSRRILAVLKRRRTENPPDGMKRGPRNPDREITSAAEAAFASPFLLTRWAGFWALALGDSPDSCARSLPFMESPLRPLRGMAAWASGVLRCTGATEGLRALLDAEDWTLRKIAVSGLGVLTCTPAFDKLLEMAKTDSIRVRYSALWACARLLDGEGLSDIQIASAQEFLVEFLLHPSDTDMVPSACSGIASIARRGKREELRFLIPRLKSLLESRNEGDNRGAAWALAELAEESDLDLIRYMSNHPDSLVRKRAAEAIGKRQIVAGMPLLMTLLKDQQVAVQSVAAKALASMPDQPAIERLLISQLETSSDNDAIAMSILAHNKNAPAIRLAVRDRLINTIDPSKPAGLVARACFALSWRMSDLVKSQDFPREPVTTNLIHLLEREGDPTLLSHVFAVLRLIPDRRAVEPCLRFVDDMEHASLRASACNVLQKFPDTRAVKPAFQLLKDPDGGVRAAACVLVASFPFPIDKIQKVRTDITELEQDDDDRVVKSVHKALGILEKRLRQLNSKNKRTSPSGVSGNK